MATSFGYGAADAMFTRGTGALHKGHRNGSGAAANHRNQEVRGRREERITVGVKSDILVSVLHSLHDIVS